MVWEQRARQLSWIFFILMGIPLAVVIWSAVRETEEPPLEALVLFFALCMLFAFLQAGSFAIGWFEKKQIKKNGTPARATILSVSETGTRVNDRPLFRIELEVQPPYDSRFVTIVEYVVPYSYLTQLQAGNKVPVFYLEDSKEVALADL
jgi:hypothetical protein